MTDPEPSHQERQLLRLLALKRHELPPPRFFEELPRRIERGIRARLHVEERSWWEKVRSLLVHEPVVAGSYAALGLGALLFGVSVFETARSAGDPSPVIVQGAFAGTPVPLDAEAASLPGGLYRAIPAGPSGGWGVPAGYTVIPVAAHPSSVTLERPQVVLLRYTP